MAIAPPFLVPSAWPWLRPVEAPVACMDAGELRRWDDANERCPWPLGAASPCRDCTEAFAAEMRFEGRCHGRPGSDVVPLELEALRQDWQHYWHRMPTSVGPAARVTLGSVEIRSPSADADGQANGYLE